ncbi:MAG: MerR family transcriptional regulator [Verrucomicrobiales bacterium]|nr:MerR family transcriptional regulator [Verrucomicrobiales bacterium]
MGEGTDDEFYEISAVSRLTGLSTHVLRVWEKRYSVVEPDRTRTKRRQYSRKDVHRLTTLKSLVDHGNTISSIANLDTRVLEERLAQVTQLENPEKSYQDTGCQVGFIGVHARKAVRDAADISEGFSLIAEFPGLDAMVENLKPGALDILIVEIGSLFPEDLESIQGGLEQLGARKAVVIYQFAAADITEPGYTEKVITLRGPVTSAEVLLACGANFDRPEIPRSGDLRDPTEVESEIPDRIFTPEALQSISKLTSVLQCECPQHIANLISGLSAFEEYSSRCENLNEDDAKLHAFLHQETALSRHRMEQALLYLLEKEGISF